MTEKTKVYEDAGNPSQTNASAPERVKVYEQKTQGSRSKWLWLIPLLLLLGLLIWYLNRDHRPAVAETASIGSVYFDTGSAALTAEDQTTLSQAAESMKQNPNRRLRVQGYTDSTGDTAQNVALSNQRSDAVKQYLTSQGVDPSRLSLEGFGQANPAASNGTSDGKASNRRVELFQQ
jgi:outer membrane protein OmpA-like peptidoglycan-associated protein